MEIIKTKPGTKIVGNIESLNTITLLGYFLDEEDIWGYEFPRPKSLDIVWNKSWDYLLDLVSDSFKQKIRNIHPDINQYEKDLAVDLTTTYNILKKRIKNKIHPESISEKIKKQIIREKKR